MIDTVIFDIGNVLIRWDMHNLFRRMFDDDGAIAAFLAETRLVEINHHQFDAGQPYTAGIEAMVARHPRHAEALRAFDSRWTECLDGAIEANVAVLRDLQQAGVTTHAISNFSVEKFPVACRLFPFLTTFDETIVSGAVKLVKPDPAIFRLLLDKRRIDPARAVFIDDTAVNIAIARSLSLETVHYVESAGVDLRERLRALGVAGL